MNRIILCGRLTRDPDINSKGDTKWSRFTIAVNRDRTREGEQQADFFDCTSFGKSADFSYKYFRKGMRVLVMGHVQMGSYTNKDGQKVPTFQVIVDSQEFADGRTDQPDQQPAAAPAPKADKDGFVPLPNLDDEGLPWA